MKLKSIAAICRGMKRVVIHNHVDTDGTLTQYIGDGAALYRINGLPTLDRDTLLTIFDIPENKREKWTVHEVSLMDINVNDTEIAERALEPMNICISHAKGDLVPLITSKGVVFLDRGYLAPIKDEMGVQQIYERRTSSGEICLAVKAGFLLQAVIMPEDIINPPFVESLSALAIQCTKTLGDRETKEKEKFPLLNKEDE